ncbi:Rv3235 family protein [Prauserella rugosa]|uniref:Uncharacterized protein n=1 Tax=Prauserella rugosa TaxID=43354 RepID=A0A660CB36_9PSEU|nr:Rv3235 family protein [Prauserella rugosa]TWH20516.1 hypothetical protein JD82_02362 [Prauserella rugosa]
MITQHHCPDVGTLENYEPHRPDGSDVGGRPILPAATVERLLLGIPGQRTGRRPREDLSRAQVEHLLVALLEVRSGHRTVAQLGDRVSPALGSRLRAEKSRKLPRYHLRSAHLCRTADDSLEVAATAWAQSRLLAVTARFECRARRWRCAQFSVLEPPAGG